MVVTSTVAPEGDYIIISDFKFLLAEGAAVFGQIIVNCHSIYDVIVDFGIVDFAMVGFGVVRCVTWFHMRIDVGQFYSADSPSFEGVMIMRLLQGLSRH